MCLIYVLLKMKKFTSLLIFCNNMTWMIKFAEPQILKFYVFIDICTILTSSQYTDMQTHIRHIKKNNS